MGILQASWAASLGWPIITSAPLSHYSWNERAGRELLCLEKRIKATVLSAWFKHTSRRITSSLKLSVSSILQLSVTAAMSRQCGCYLNRKCSFCFHGWLLSPVWQLFLAGYGMSAPGVSRDCITVTSADFSFTPVCSTWAPCAGSYMCVGLKITLPDAVFTLSYLLTLICHVNLCSQALCND